MLIDEIELRLVVTSDKKMKISMASEKEYFANKLSDIEQDVEKNLQFERVYSYVPEIYKSLSGVKSKPIQPSTYHEYIFNNYQNYMDVDRLVYSALLRFLQDPKQFDLGYYKALSSYCGYCNLIEYQRIMNNLCFLVHGFILEINRQTRAKHRDKLNSLCLKYFTYFALSKIKDKRDWEVECLSRLIRDNSRFQIFDTFEDEAVHKLLEKNNKAN